MPSGSVAETLLETKGWQPTFDVWILDLPPETEIPPPRLPDGLVLGVADGPDDLRTVHGIIDGAFSEWAGRRPQSYDDWHAEMIDRPDAATWQVRVLREATGEIVGAATVMGSAGGIAFVHELAVRRDLRGQGLGTALLADAVTAGRERGYRGCQLSTDSRSGAVALYERLGFAVTSTWRSLARDVS